MTPMEQIQYDYRSNYMAQKNTPERGDEKNWMIGTKMYSIISHAHAVIRYGMR